MGVKFQQRPPMSPPRGPSQDGSWNPWEDHGFTLSRLLNDRSDTLQVFSCHTCFLTKSWTEMPVCYVNERVAQLSSCNPSYLGLQV